MNSVALVGRLTKDPELGHIESQDGRAVCDLRIAISNGAEKPPTYVDVSTFDRQAEACATYLAKGREVAVSGRLVYREWAADDGSKRSKHSVIGRVQFLGSGNGSADAGDADNSDPESTPDGEDIPF
jgi:single-strand DNA-binding protein